MYRVTKHHFKKNPFITFAEEKKLEWESEGRKFPGGIKEVVPLAGEIWKTMTEEERHPYKTKATNWNGNQLEEKLLRVQTTKLAELLHISQSSRPLGYNSNSGQVITSRTNGGGDEATAMSSRSGNGHHKKTKPKKIELLLNPKTADHVKNLVFVIINFSCFSTVDGNYLPAEIGLTAFSINSGIIANFGTLIDPGTETMVHEVIKFCNRVGMPDHRDWPTKSCDFRKVTRTMQKFLQENAAVVGDDDNMLLFCKKEDFDTVNGCLQWLIQDASGESMKPEEMKYELLSLDELFLQLVSAGNNKHLEFERQQRVASEEVEPEAETQEIQELNLDFKDIFVKDPPTKTGFKNEIDDEGLALPIFASEGEAGVYLRFQDFLHISELSCSYHLLHEVGVRLCALNKTNRYALIMLDVLVGYWSVEPEEGRHSIHKTRRTEVQRRRDLLAVWNGSSFQIQKMAAKMESETHTQNKGV